MEKAGEIQDKETLRDVFTDLRPWNDMDSDEAVEPSIEGRTVFAPLGFCFISPSFRWAFSLYLGRWYFDTSKLPDLPGWSWGDNTQRRAKRLPLQRLQLFEAEGKKIRGTQIDFLWFYIFFLKNGFLVTAKKNGRFLVVTNFHAFWYLTTL